MPTLTYQAKLALAGRLRDYLDALDVDLYSVTINFHTVRSLPSDDDPTEARDVELLVRAVDPSAFAEAFRERHGGGRYVDVHGDVWVFGEASNAVRWRLRIVPGV